MTHKFTYQYQGRPATISVEIDQDANLTEIIEAFESYLKACEYPMDSKHIELVEK